MYIDRYRFIYRHLSIFLPIYLYPSIILLINQSFYLSMSLSIYVTIDLSIYLTMERDAEIRIQVYLTLRRV